MKRNKYDVLIIAPTTFPIGQAQTNRVYSYTKVLAEDLKVKFISSIPNFNESPLNHAKGRIDGIDYQIAIGSSKWSRNWSRIRKAIYIYGSRILKYWQIIKEKPKTVILADNDQLTIYILTKLSKLFGFRLVLERTELTHYKNTSEVKKALSIISKVSGVLAISNEIAEFYGPIQDKTEVFVLPMSVNMSRFPKEKIENRIDGKYFVMCSGNNWERDGALDSINAYLKFRKSHPEYHLKVAGNIKGNDEYSNQIREILKQNQDKGIEYLGLVGSESIPDLIINATAALMTPHQDYASGGFPTKLGEYLASGNPVVCTAVSEIPNYLNAANAYVCQPNDVDAMVAAMEDIVTNPQKAKEIGLAGRETANKYFNVNSYKEELIKFVMGSK